MSDLLSWLWNHIEEMSLLLGGIGSVTWYYFSHWKAELADPASLEKLRPYLDDSPWRTTYRRTLNRALNAANRFFGPPISWRAYGVCLSIAFFYPILLFLLTWVLGDPHALGTLETLPEGWPTDMRVALIAGLVLYMYTILLLFRSRVALHRRVLATGSSLLAGIAGYVITGDVTFAVAVTLIVAVVLVIAISLANAIDFINTIGYARALAFVFAVDGALVFGLAVSGTVTAAGSFTGVFAFTVALAVAGTGLLGEGWTDVFNPAAMSVFLFVFVLPLLNAALDTFSWAVSRWLGREMLDRNFYRWGMIGFAVLDAVLAFVFLCGLAVLLSVVGEAVDQFAAAKIGSPVLGLLLGFLNRDADAELPRSVPNRIRPLIEPPKMAVDQNGAVGLGRCNPATCTNPLGTTDEACWVSFLYLPVLPHENGADRL